MFRNLLLGSPVFRLMAVATTMALACLRAEAQQVINFKISGGGNATQGVSLVPLTPTAHTATGTGTPRLGRYTGAGFFQILSFTGPLTANFSSAPDFVFTGANGDQLAVTYGVVANGAPQPGQMTLTPHKGGSFTAHFVAVFNPEPAKCTGRFAGITGGSWVMIAQTSPFFIQGTATTPFTYTWQGQGQLVFGGAGVKGGRGQERNQPSAASQAALLQATIARQQALRQAHPAARTR
jgi:hypothetical protein